MRGIFFWRKKKKKLEKKKPCMFIVLAWNIFSTFFFFWEKNIPHKSDEHGWVFFSRKKKMLKKISMHVFGTCAVLYPYCWNCIHGWYCNFNWLCKGPGFFHIFGQWTPVMFETRTKIRTGLSKTHTHGIAKFYTFGLVGEGRGGDSKTN